MNLVKEFLVDYGTARGLGFDSIQSFDHAAMKARSRARLKQQADLNTNFCTPQPAVGRITPASSDVANTASLPGRSHRF